MAIASTVAWIWLVGMLGSKIITFGPKSGSEAELETKSLCDAAVPPLAAPTNSSTPTSATSPDANTTANSFR